MLIRIILLAAGLNLAFISQSMGQSAASTTYRMIDEVSFMISGTSNVRDWSAETDNMQGRIIAGPDFTAWRSDGTMPESGEDTGSGWFEEVTFSVISKELDSGISALNNTLHNSLKADQHERIRYRLSDVKQVRNGEQANELVFLVNGVTRAAGVDHPVEHEVTVSRVDADKLTISGEMEMQITDYEIDPPTFMRGALVTEDKVKVTYRFNIGTRQ